MFKIRTASRLDRVAPSITLAITAKAKTLRAQGVDVLSYAAGEPDFDTPDHIKEAARRGLDRGVAKYTMVTGLPELRGAVSRQIAEVHGASVAADDVVITTGAKQALYNLFQALLEDGDEVVIPAPYWVSYPDMVKLAGGNPVIVDTDAEDNFAMSAAAFENALSDRTRAVILNTPSNPTGAVYSRAQLEALAEVACKRDILVVSDDIYRSLVYGDTRYVSFASLSPEAAERTVFIDGVSKSYAMTGWRIGWAAGPSALIKAMSKVQSQSTSNASHIAQVAALEAITGPQECIAEMRAAFDERRRAIVRLLNDIDGVTCREPEGAFYCFPDVSSFRGARTPGGDTIEDDVDLASYLLDAVHVAVVPGSGFGAPGFVRLSYACSMADIELGVTRMKDALGRLTRA